MIIALASKGVDLDAPIAEEFEKSPYLLMVETDNMSYEVFQNPELEDGLGLAMAEKVVASDCEAVISGTIEAEAFEVLSEAQVTRYYGANIAGRKALDMMQAYELDYIRVPNGEMWEPHDHSQGTCNCGEH
ncbi:MAG: hypothetical protein GXY34_08130 [Syntrophomonadaceae bacterium]|nr:hypothetical protein [Syntrophomonadaceae bacterium]